MEKIKLDYKIFFHSIMLYPLALAILTAIGKEAFFITAPYFFLNLLLLLFIVFARERIVFKIWNLLQLFLLILLISIGVYNFTSFRYSLPLFFIIYAFVLQFFLTKYSNSIHYSDFNYFKHYFIFYIILSILFILFPLSPFQKLSRFDGFLGSPTVYSAYLVLLYILSLSNFKTNLPKILGYLIVLVFVYLSKTRLILLLMIIIPLLSVAIDYWKLSLKKIFLTIFLVLIFLYPAYKTVVEYFPNLVTMRYEQGKDRSYDLRYYLYVITQEDFSKQDLKTKIFGQGNEHSRLFVKKKLNGDVYPHNDFIRIISDWGILGGVLFFLLLYRYAIRSKIALIITIIYMIQFYSNLIFNLFLISILLIIANLSSKEIENTKENNEFF
ncbi:MAG: hypothetical protein CO068_04620 [Flavobacteriaceae bacterium CG_4_9_14_0_8_um_filter_34_30]|nr:MAG: hypothetical protein CO068_04620 [Flavobacteriaceae bacterium CG_4_9_14_0_8_um_filter_34_30]